MRISASRFYAVIMLSWCFFGTNPACAALITFEGIADNTILGNTIPGLNFNGGTVLTAGVSLNEFDYPPTSGDNVVFVSTGLLDIIFGSAQSSVSGYFTFASPLNISAFNSLNNLVASVISSAPSNLGSAGLLSVAGGDIVRVSITSAGAFAFTLDNLNVATGGSVSVPEPATSALLLTGLAGMSCARRLRKRRNFAAVSD